MNKRRNWTVDEVQHALALYLVTDFGRIHNRNPDIIALARHLGRSHNAVALKMVNLAALDESLPRKGMANASKTDRLVWEQFLHNPEPVIAVYDSVLSRFTQQPPPPANTPAPTGFSEARAHFHGQIGREQPVLAKRRVGQDFFRRMVLTSYGGKCALTGIEDSRLLNASHIIAWKDDAANRMNPANGICLNALHDRAFDRHLITFDEDYRMIVSETLPPTAKKEIQRVQSPRLTLPGRFLPSQDFLETHRRLFFEKNAAPARWPAHGRWPCS